MATISLNAVRPGTCVKIEGQPYVVLKTQHSHMGRGGATLKLKIKNLITSGVLEKTFKGDDRIEQADTERRQATFLYTDNNRDSVAFMDAKTYEQMDLNLEVVEEYLGYLKEGSEVNILFFEDTPIGVEIPSKVELKVIDAPQGVRGDTAQGSVTQPITLETGLIINAPLFVKNGDIVRVNTERCEYVERV